MNYRHAFHAGNFADLVKHAALLELLWRLAPANGPLTVVDTHAGAGRYDLGGPEALASGEAAAGVGRLLAAEDAPEPLQALARAVRAAGENAYPGSPWLVAQRLRPQDRLLACELRPAEHAALARLMAGRRNVEVRCADGFAAAPAAIPRRGAVLALIDPPFERADDYRRTATTLSRILGRNREAVVLVWLPLKDLETFDSAVRDLEDAADGAPMLAAETRLRPLADPLRMNGCALVLANPPAGVEPALEAACGWTAQLGQAGEARVWRVA